MNRDWCFQHGLSPCGTGKRQNGEEGNGKFKVNNAKLTINNEKLNLNRLNNAKTSFLS